VALTIEHVRLTDIVPADTNPKRHDINTLIRSYTRFGYAEAIIQDGRTGKLVAGHGRVEALAALHRTSATPPDGIQVGPDGEWLVPVQMGWSSANDEEANAFLVAANRLTETGGWDDQTLADLLAVIARGPSGLEGIGYTEAELADLIAALAPPSEFPSFDPDSLGTEYTCPSCGYQWSGTAGVENIPAPSP
jgi:ParB-like chromosome segregation protein Spo0J